MTSIKILRPNDYLNRYRKIRLYIDGNKIGSISRNEVMDFTLPDGSHIIQAKIDWCSSNKLAFTIAENEVQQFELTDFAKGSQPGVLEIFSKIFFKTDEYLCLTKL